MIVPLLMAGKHGPVGFVAVRRVVVVAVRRVLTVAVAPVERAVAGRVTMGAVSRLTLRNRLWSLGQWPMRRRNVNQTARR